MANATGLSKVYDSDSVQAEMWKRWEQAGAFHAAPDPSRPAYVILIPPPNVTAALHMGHALNNSLQDMLIRWRRMCGDNAVWIPGTDHAGIATQTVVEKRVLAEEGKRRTDFERAEFVARIQAWKDQYEARITEQLKAMGCSCDWDRQRFTMDDVCAAAVRDAFFLLFRDGLIYRGKRLVNWDPVTQTALADDEVETREIDGHFWYLRYPLLDDADQETGEHVVVATTRPETMLGDTAVAVNPKDQARAALIGRRVRVPIVNRIVEVIGDDYVVIPDPESDDAKARFASGFLKVTPAHDPNDWDIGLRHDLPVINVLAPDGSISLEHGWPEEDHAAAAPFLAASLVGTDRYEARDLVVRWFTEHELLREVRPYSHAVGHSYRSHAAIEPYLSDQWYVKVTDERLAGAALRALAEDQRVPGGECVWKGGGSFEGGAPELTETEGGLRFWPERYAKTFQSWHENLRDWCISRQLWWGHQIPVWSREGDEAPPIEIDAEAACVQRDGRATHVCLRRDDPTAIAALEEAGFQRDPDVLDTWFSSALWPISTLGWPEPSANAQAFPNGDAALRFWNPSSTLCTAREIITLWVSRMTMFNLYFRGRLPFRDVFIHAMIQDGEGQKMSKSLGNGVDPLDIIHSHGADAMRFTLATMTTDTQDVRMPVSLICPHTDQMFDPLMVTTRAGHRVMAAIQSSPGDESRQMVTSYGVASGEAKPTDEIPLARNTSPKFDGGRNFANKLWNAGRFALQKVAGKDLGAAPSEDDDEPTLELGVAERWVLSRLGRTIREVNQALQRFQFNRYAQVVYDFVWRDYCDWYLEAVKPVTEEETDAGRVARRVVLGALDAAVRLLHPIMPFLTERLWSGLCEVTEDRSLPGLDLVPSELCIRAAWPRPHAPLIDDEAEAHFDEVRAVVAQVRNARAHHGVPPKTPVSVHLRAPEGVAVRLEESRRLIETLAWAKVVALGAKIEPPAGAVSGLAGEIEVFLEGLVDVAAERERLEKRTAELGKRHQSLSGRLQNPGYINKAPAHLVQQTRDELARVEQEQEALGAQLAALTG